MWQESKKKAPLLEGASTRIYDHIEQIAILAETSLLLIWCLCGRIQKADIWLVPESAHMAKIPEKVNNTKIPTQVWSRVQPSWA